MSVHALGTIKHAAVTFRPGLNVITGETGTGKTMVLRALTLALGGKTDASWIAHGNAEAIVDVAFDLSPEMYLQVADLAPDICDPGDVDATVVLGRVVGGRSRSSVNSRVVPAATQAGIAEMLISIHGQHDQRSLTKPARQQLLLDRFAGAEHLQQTVQLAAMVSRMRGLEDALMVLQARRSEFGAQAEAAKAWCAAFDELNPSSDELELLDLQIGLLTQAEHIRGVLTHAQAALDGADEGGGARAAIHGAAREMQRLGEQHEKIASLATRLSQAAFELDDLIAEVRNLGETISANPHALERLHSRRADLQRLLRVTGQPNVAALSTFIEQQRVLTDPDAVDAEIAVLQLELIDVGNMTADLASGISHGRAIAATELESAVSARLQTLGLDGAHFIVTLSPCPVGMHGAETVEFLLQTADVPVPLGSGVSGGEMSRIALALECALAGADPVPVMVFDEVDAGIGGRTAHEVARALADLADTAQVIVVTHLPQVAALAHHHLRVTRDADGTRVHALSEDERIHEVARMLGHAEGLAAAREYAIELLQRRSS